MGSRANAKLEFIPWDCTSATHRSRLKTQRVACGWATESLDLWAEKGKSGKKTFYWIVLRDDCPDRDEQLARHVERFPQEAAPIVDTATQHWLAGRTPSNRSFIPVGHFGLETRPDDDVQLGLPSDGVVWIGPLYISWALQRGGYGGTTMRKAEEMAAAAPLHATWAAIDAVPEEFQFSDAVMRTAYLGRGIPKPAISNEKWYRKQGYEEFHRVQNLHEFPFEDTDETDELEKEVKAAEPVPVPLVFLKKQLK